MELKNYIRDVQDFPKPGILFKDITTLLMAPEAFRETIRQMEEKLKGLNINAIAGIESRGFIFGAVLAEKMNLPFIPIRKKGKLPAETVAMTYDLEYGTDTIEIHSDVFDTPCNFAVIDDLLATGGTAEAAAKLIKKGGAEISAMIFLIELDDLKGRDKLSEFNIQSLLHY